MAEIDKFEWAADLKGYISDRELVACTVIIAIIVNFVHLSSFSLSIDEELASFAVQPWKLWIAQGRWGMGLLNLVLPDYAPIPFISTLIFIIGITVAALWLAQLVSKTRHEALFFSGFFVASPIWLNITEFNTLAAGTGIAMLITALALKLVSLERVLPVICAGLCVGFAIGIYQSLIIVYTIGCVVLLFPGCYFWFDKKYAAVASFRRFFWIAVSFLIAAIFYILMQRMLLFASGQHTTYIDSYVQVGELFAAPKSTISRVLAETGGLLFGTDSVYLGWGRLLLVAPAVGFLYGVICIVRHGSSDYVRALLSILALVLIVLSCAALIVMAAGRMPVRALIGFPFLFALLAINSYRIEFFRARWPQWIFFGYAMLICVWIGAALFYADKVVRQRDQLMATQIASVVNSIAHPSLHNSIPFVLVGEHSFPDEGVARHVQIFGSSFFEQDGGNPYRVAAYLRFLGVEGLQPLPITRLQKYVLQIRGMPSWPKPGSVSIIDHVLVIKLGDVSYQQQLLLDASPSNKP